MNTNPQGTENVSGAGAQLRPTELPWVAERYEHENKSEVATVALIGDWRVGVPTPGYPGGNYRDTDWGTDEHDAKYIVRACNSHDAFKRLLKRASKSIQDWCDSRDYMPDEDAELLAEIRAALAAAEAE